MSHRAWVSACVATAVIAVALMRPASAELRRGKPIAAAGQAPAAAKPAPPEETTPVAKPWTVPRTPWGDPDFQGVWTRAHFNVFVVPFERPRELGEKVELTEVEHQARLAAAAQAAKTTAFTRPTDVSFDDDISPYLTLSRRTSVVVDPPDGRVPPYTSEAQKRVDAAAAARQERALAGVNIGPEHFSLGERCITRGFPAVMNPAPTTSSGLQIVQGPGYVVLRFELMNEYRLIPVAGQASLGPNFPQWFGQSRGRWEGDTLVVETTNFNGRSNFRGTGERMRVVERFTRTSFGELDYQYTVDDPSTFIRPWTARASWGLNNNQVEIAEYACHPGNRDLPMLIRIAQMEAERETKQSKEAAPKKE